MAAVKAWVSKQQPPTEGRSLDLLRKGSFCKVGQTRDSRNLWLAVGMRDEDPMLTWHRISWINEEGPRLQEPRWGEYISRKVSKVLQMIPSFSLSQNQASWCFLQD